MVHLVAFHGPKKSEEIKTGLKFDRNRRRHGCFGEQWRRGMYNDLKNSLDCLRQVVSEGFVNLHTDLDKLRFEFKTEIEAVKMSIKDIEKSLTYTQSEVEGLIEHFEMEIKEHSKEVDTLIKKIADLEDRLKQQVENNIALEQYAQRENLRFNNIKEKEHEDCRAVVYKREF